MRFVPVAAAVLAALLLSGCGGSADDDGKAGTGAVAVLSSVGELRDAFRKDGGVARVVLLLSPT